ncbi:MAG: flagellar hook protein FlgE [Thermodesulfobacteriota bacterium]
MGLSTSLYSATSGLGAHSEKMSTIGNNLSNVSTTAFKKSRMHFEDAMYQNITTASGNDQLGRGVSTSSVMSDFSQGSKESTNQSTDLAIGGEGFFTTSPKGQEKNNYTRAGNFRFDKDGYLTDPHDNVVQGWQVAEEDKSGAASGKTSDEEGVKTEGVPTDIRLEDFQSSPQATERVNQMVNLDARSEDRNTNSENPYFAMFNDWDSADDKPLADNRYAYQSTIKVYDSNGSSHDLTTYFDPVEDDVENEGGKQHWEYLTAVSPNEDNRTFWEGAASEEKRGILMSGNLRFSSTGQMESRSAFTLRDTDDTTDGTQFAAADDDPNNPENWLPAQFSSEGKPLTTPNFRGGENANTTNQVTENDEGNNIAINFGATNRDLSEEFPDYPYLSGWDNLDDTDQEANSIEDWGSNETDADGNDIVDLDQDPFPMPNYKDFNTQARSTTNFSSGSTTNTQDQDGYAPGFLQELSVDRDGVMTGNYSNGQVKNLYVTTLAQFNSDQGLRKEGGNMFSETRESGPPLTGKPGTGGLGTIESNSLEESNVDMSEEFVKMITTQKGFQANARTITTTDDMLQEVVNLKR